MLSKSYQHMARRVAGPAIAPGAASTRPAARGARARSPLGAANGGENRK
jgi:hypothetical protein